MRASLFCVSDFCLCLVFSFPLHCTIPLASPTYLGFSSYFYVTSSLTYLSFLPLYTLIPLPADQTPIDLPDKNLYSKCNIASFPYTFSYLSNISICMSKATFPPSRPFSSTVCLVRCQVSPAWSLSFLPLVSSLLPVAYADEEARSWGKTGIFDGVKGRTR